MISSGSLGPVLSVRGSTTYNRFHPLYPSSVSHWTSRRFSLWEMSSWNPYKG